MKNSIETPTFGKDNSVSYDSAQHGVNPENEHIIIDTCTVRDSQGQSEKWVAIRRLDSVRIIAEKDGEIYFAKQTMPDGSCHYTAFGGSVNAGESPETAAARELMEEAGMQGELELLMRWENPDNRLKWVWSVFIARHVQVIGAQQLDALEKVEVVKVPNFNAFVQIMSNQHLKEDPKATPFKDTNLTAILNNYLPINHAAMDAICKRILKQD